MWTLIVTLLLWDGSTKVVDLHSEAPSQWQCLMDQSTMANELPKYQYKKIVSWKCIDKNKQDI